MDIGEIRIGDKKLRPDITKQKIQVKLGKCLNTTKYILITACVILFILGIALFGVGVSTLVSQKTVQVLHVPGISSLPIWMIVIGLFICILSFTGGFGSLFYRHSYLIIFGSILGILLIFELSVGIAAIVQKDKLPSVVDLAWDKSTDDTKEYIQMNFDCCGFHNVSDRAYLEKCPSSKVTSTKVEDTCGYVLLNVLRGTVGEIGAAAIVIAVFEIGTMACTFALAKRIKNETGETAGYTSVSQNTFGDDEEDGDSGLGGDVIGDVKFGNDSLDDDDGEIDFFAISNNNQTV